MDDLIFGWEEKDPLVVDEKIELPQHNLIASEIGECHQVYSSGESCLATHFTQWECLVGNINCPKLRVYW